MKKNTILYLLLIVLMVMNGFFLINYLGRPVQKGPKAAGDFIVKELRLNASQLEQFKTLEDSHHNTMRAIGDATKEIKDELFQKITAPNIDQTAIDSLIGIISEKEQLKEKEMYKRLRGIYELCDDKQKEHFSDIIKKAHRFDNKRPERPERPNE